MIDINTVIPMPANAGFTTDRRMHEALIKVVKQKILSANNRGALHDVRQKVWDKPHG